MNPFVAILVLVFLVLTLALVVVGVNALIKTRDEKEPVAGRAFPREMRGLTVDELVDLYTLDQLRRVGLNIPGYEDDYDVARRASDLAAATKALEESK